MVNKKKFLPVIVISFCLFFGFLYLFVSPPMTAPDEIAHLAYPRYLLQENKLPSFTTSEDFWESHQPPLYYILSIPIVKFMSTFPIFNQLLLNRIISLIIFASALFLFLSLLKKLFPGSHVLQASAISFFGIPMVCYLAGSFSNDILMVFVSVLLSYWIFFLSEKTFGNKEALFFGLCLGLGLLTKVHIYPLVFLAWLFVLWKKPFVIWLETSLCAFLISFWWFLHNLKNTGDVFGLSHTFILWQSQQENITSLSGFFILCAKLWSGFLGVFGKFTITYPIIIYAIGSLALILYCVVLIKNLADSRIKKITFVILAILFVVIIQNFSFYQPQGRYLVAIVPFMGIGLAIGIQKFRSDISRLTLFYSIGIFLITINLSGFFLIHTYYKKNPIESLEQSRTINLLEKKFVGDADHIKKSADLIEISLPAKIATLQDLRLDSSKKPTLHITTTNQNEYSLVLKWKKLGDTSFDNSRSLKESFVGSAEIQIEEPQNTLIQDIQVEIQSTHDNITISDFSIYTR